MRARHVVFGLDGADLRLVEALGPSRLPTLHRLMAAGAYAAQRSVLPAATLPNWTTFLTGVDPGRHGVFDFTIRTPNGLRFAGGSVREAPTLFARLDAAGVPCAVLFFPATYPPEPLVFSDFVSGWDSPVAFEADRSFVHPPTLADELARRFGPLRFDDVDEFDADRPGWHEALASALVARARRKVEVCTHLLRRRHYEVFAVYFGELDTASHHLFAHHDLGSPRSPGMTPAHGGLAAVYEAIDAAVGALLEEAGGDAVEVTVVSDHGAGATSDRVVYLNRGLEAAGLLRFRPPGAFGRVLSVAKQLALGGLSPRVREQVFRFGGGMLPSWLESRARTAALDLPHTVAHSDELSYFPSVWLGPAAAGRREDALRDVERVLRGLRDPETGAALVAEVHRREHLFEGPYVERAPDLVLELSDDRGYLRNLARSEGRGPLVERLPPALRIGRKGGSLPGGHRREGLFVAAGPSVAPVGRIECDIADASATLLARLGREVPSAFAGRVLHELLVDAGACAPLPSADGVRGVAHYDEAAIERRLRALGYVDG